VTALTLMYSWFRKPMKQLIAREQQQEEDLAILTWVRQSKNVLFVACGQVIASFRRVTFVHIQHLLFFRRRREQQQEEDLAILTWAFLQNAHDNYTRQGWCTAAEKEQVPKEQFVC